TKPVRRALPSVCVGIALAVLAAAAPAGQASFPGKNGLVAFGFLGGTIVAENVDGTGRKTIVGPTNNVAVAPTEPAWSADGTKLAYSSKIAGTGGIFIVNADGTGTQRVTNDVNDGE